MAKITFLLLFFAIMMPLIYAGCPEDTCCPVGDNCDRNSALCKPSASKDCKKVRVRFNKSVYRRNEDREPSEVCFKLKLNRRIPIKLKVKVHDISYTATGGVDYESGPYSVTIKKGKTAAKFCIHMINDNISEINEVFGLVIDTASLPSGVGRANPYTANVTITDNEVTLNFSSTTYEGYEHDGLLCVTLTLDKPALPDTNVEITESRGTAISGRDYEVGPYYVTIPRGTMSANYCINITNDEVLERDETFIIRINKTALHPDVVLVEPDVARITILDDEYTFCFDQHSYVVLEDGGPLLMSMSLSRALPFDISVRFIYRDITAFGNETVEEGFDYYTSLSFPYFDVIPAYTRHYSLKVNIVADRIRENTELFQITPQPQHIPAGHSASNCRADVIIIDDDDDIQLSFNQSTYRQYEHKGTVCVTLVLNNPATFDITVKITIDVNSTAVDGTDYEKGPYCVTIPKGTTSADYCINITNDEVLEHDEVFIIHINKTALHPDVVLVEPDEATVTIMDDEYIFCFTRTSYFAYESDRSLQMIVKLSRPLPDDILVQFRYYDISATGNRSTLIEDDIDYYASYSYPNFAVVEAYSTHFSLNISIVQDCKLERTELFRVTAFPPQLPFGHVQCTTDVLIGDSYYTQVNFSEAAYTVYEHQGVLCLMLVLDKPAPTDFKVNISDVNYTATGNVDYVTGPYNVMFMKGNATATLCINITNDEILEEDETFGLIIDAVSSLACIIHGSPYTANVTILRTEFFRLSFKQGEYFVNGENRTEIPVLELTYPASYPSYVFPIIVAVDEIDITATGGSGSNTGGVDYIYQNYTFMFYDGDKNKSLILRPVDDNIVEPEEIYSLTIRLVYTDGHVKIGENGSTTVTIFDDDVCYISISQDNGQDHVNFSKPLSIDVIVNITYDGDRSIITTITAAQTTSPYPLTIPRNRINDIEVLSPEEIKRRVIYFDPNSYI